MGWRRLPRRRTALVGTLGIGVVGLLVAVLFTTPSGDAGSATWVGARARPTAGPPTSPASTPERRAATLTLRAPANPAVIRVPGTSRFGWALLDRRTGAVAGSKNLASFTSTAESMIKPWIAADYLRRLAAAGKQPSERTLDELAATIVDSHDPLTEKYYRLGGSDAVVRRLASICGLATVRIEPELWSWTELAPRDAAGYGECLADGRAAGPRWTPWLLQTMRAVRGGVAQQGDDTGGGRWGIIEALPPELARDTGIKNGWTSYVDGWHVNCLAVHEDWVLAVMIRTYGGLRSAAQGCRTVAAALVTPDLATPQ